MRKLRNSRCARVTAEFVKSATEFVSESGSFQQGPRPTSTLQPPAGLLPGYARHVEHCSQFAGAARVRSQRFRHLQWRPATPRRRTGRTAFRASTPDAVPYLVSDAPPAPGVTPPLAASCNNRSRDSGRTTPADARLPSAALAAASPSYAASLRSRQISDGPTPWPGTTAATS